MLKSEEIQHIFRRLYCNSQNLYASIFFSILLLLGIVSTAIVSTFLIYFLFVGFNSSLFKCLYLLLSASLYVCLFIIASSPFLYNCACKIFSPLLHLQSGVAEISYIINNGEIASHLLGTPDSPVSSIDISPVSGREMTLGSPLMIAVLRAKSVIPDIEL